MIHAILDHLTDAGVLEEVTYSLTFDTPRRIRAIELKFSTTAIVFAAEENQLRIKRGRVCSPGACLDEEICCTASQTFFWLRVLNATTVEVDRIASSETNGEGCRLTFGGRDERLVAIEIVPEDCYLWLSDLNGENAWGGDTKRST